MSNEYLDIDSTYRDRNLWPLPGQFEIPIAQSGIKQKGEAIDPVSLAEPVAVWSCNGLTTSQASTFQIYGKIAPPVTYGNVGYNLDTKNFTIVFTDTYNNSVQTADDYYVGLIFWNVTNSEFSRITSYKYIGNSQTTPSTWSIALISIADSLTTINFDDTFNITDTSDLSRTNYPILFVPNGKEQDDAYLNYILYCETNNDYRNITKYDSLRKYVFSEAWSEINNIIYQYYGNFCIRKEPPLFPLKLETSQFVNTTSTSTIVNVTISGSCSLKIFTTDNTVAIQNKITIPYKYDFLRIRPYRTTSISNNILLAGSGDNNIGSTINGIQFTDINNSILSTIFDITNNGPNASSLRWVSVGYLAGIATDTITYSDDGITWIASANNPFFSGSSVSHGLCVFYYNYSSVWFAGGGSIFSPPLSPFAVSNDGNNWTSLTTPFTDGIVNGISVTRKNGLNFVVVVGRDVTATRSIIYGSFIPPSIISYALVTNDPFIGGQGNNVLSNDIYFVAVGYNSLRTQCIAVSMDGGNWATSTNNPFTGGEGISIGWNGSHWVAVGRNTINSVSIARSSNGFDWTISTNNPFFASYQVNDVIWSGSYWIAVGGSGAGNFGIGSSCVAISSDGLYWTSTKLIDDQLGKAFFSISIYNNTNFTNVGIYNENLVSQSRQITAYTNNGTTASFTVTPPFTGTNLFATASTYTIEVEQFSYDNFNPFSYTGTLVQQASCYEFELVNLILPNYTLASGNGSKIAFYPYVYVEISNVSSSGSKLKNILSSNNPNATKMIFKIPIYDIQDPLTTPFVRLIDASMTQTIKFKPDDNLYFTVKLPNGDVFQTLLPETFSPEIPNANAQVSATFRLKRY